MLTSITARDQCNDKIGGKLWARLFGIVHTAGCERRSGADMAYLSTFDDHLLRDVGLTRDELERTFAVAAPMFGEKRHASPAAHGSGLPHLDGYELHLNARRQRAKNMSRVLILAAAAAAWMPLAGMISKVTSRLRTMVAGAWGTAALDERTETDRLLERMSLRELADLPVGPEPRFLNSEDRPSIRQAEIHRHAP